MRPHRRLGEALAAGLLGGGALVLRINEAQETAAGFTFQPAVCRIQITGGAFGKSHLDPSETAEQGLSGLGKAQPPGLEQRNPVSQTLHLVDIMRGDEHRPVAQP